MNKRGLGSVAVVVGLLAPLFASTPASAQEWLKDRRYQEGAGYRTGDFELHPGIGIQAGYDSNYLLRSDKTGVVNGCPSFCPEQSAGMIVAPSLTLSTLGTQRQEDQPNGAAVEPRPYNFGGGLSASYREDFGTLTPEQRNVGLGANAHLDILPGRPVGAALFTTYGRTIQPAVFGNPDLSYNRDDIGVGGEVVALPGRGTLDWHFGYQFHDTLFEESAGTPYDSITHELSTRGRWKFRPRTALIYDATMRFSNFTNGGNGITQLHNSTPLRTRIGLNGLITDHLSLLAMVGWGASFFDIGNSPPATVKQYDSVIGQAQVTYTFGHKAGDNAPLTLVHESLSSIALGYTRDFQGSLVSDFYGSDRGYANLSFFFAGRMLLVISGGLGAVEYPELFITTNGGVNHAGFTDLRADGTLFAEYRFLDSVGVNATFRYTANISNAELNLGQTQLYAMEWQRIEAYAGVRWFM